MKNVVNHKIIRTLICMVLVSTMIVGMASTAFATISGTETWYGPSDVSNPFTVTNNSMSPNKTMGFGGSLFIWARFQKADSYNPVKVIMIVYNRTQGTNTSVTIHSYDSQVGVNVGMTVNTGDVLQVFFDVCTEDGYTPPGYYRKATITYGYSNTYGTW